uniref:Coiled-coil domain-containing protein n=1 Tax=Setaria digitata TaxID=48799 RepID=A0A915PRA2_9BILA
MKGEEIPRTRNAKYNNTLDELLEIRYKKGSRIQQAAELVERPATRHGRNREAVTVLTNKDSFPLSLKREFLSKSGVIVERWQRESDGEGKSDDNDEDEEKEHGDDNEQYNFCNTTEVHDNKIHEIQKDGNKCEMNAVATAQEHCTKVAPSSLITIGNENSIQQLFGNSDERQDSEKSVRIGRKENHCPELVIGKTFLTGRPLGNLNGRFQTPNYRASKDEINRNISEVRESVEKDSRSMTHPFNEASSSGKVAYEAWLREKIKQEREKRRKQQEKEELEKRAREERRREAERNYEIWKQRADEAIREKRRKKKEKAEALEKEKAEEIRRKKEEASKMFQAWKNDRFQRLSKERQQRIQNEENDELKKKRELETKSNEAQKAFNIWYEKNKIRKAEAQRKLLESRKIEETQSRNTKEYKEALAREAYDVWLQIKENERRFNESLQGRIIKFDEMSRRFHSVPWVPPSNTVPWKFVPTRPRRHQSVKRSVKSNQTLNKKFSVTIHRSKSAIR